MTSSAPNAWLPQPLRKLAGRALESALAHVLSLDPESQTTLGPLEGRRVELHLRGPELSLAIEVAGGRLRVGPPQEASQLRVAATPGALLAMALRRGEGAAPGAVDIAGDADLARRLERLAGGFAPDFEEAFARSFGDVLGVPLARGFSRALTHARRSARQLAEDGADWLRDDARLTPARAEVEDFLDGVDALRERSERLEARLRRLESRRRERRS